MAAAIVHQSEAHLVGVSKVALKTPTEVRPQLAPGLAASVAGTRQSVNHADR
jgi:hypothetical protein